MDAATGKPWDEDPGWNFGWRSLVLLIPVVQLLYTRRTRGELLVNLRNAYLSFVGSLFVYGLILPSVVPFRGDKATLGWVIALVALAAAASVFPRLVERPLSCDDLAGGYRTRMFLRIAFANSIALFGFVFAFTSMSNWLYYVGVLLAVPGFVRAAPTRQALIREQDELAARGCNHSLVAALRTSPPKAR